MRISDWSSDVCSSDLGDAAASAAMLAALFLFWTCLRLWRQRAAWIFHDGARLYRGGALSWTLGAVRAVVTTRSGTGLPALRLGRRHRRKATSQQDAQAACVGRWCEYDEGAVGD